MDPLNPNPTPPIQPPHRDQLHARHNRPPRTGGLFIVIILVVLAFFALAWPRMRDSNRAALPPTNQTTNDGSMRDTTVPSTPAPAPIDNSGSDANPDSTP